MLREQSTAKASRAGAIIAIATLAAAVVVLDEVGAWHHGIHIASPTPIAGLEGQILEGQASLRTIRAVRTAPAFKMSTWGVRALQPRLLVRILAPLVDVTRPWELFLNERAVHCERAVHGAAFRFAQIIEFSALAVIDASCPGCV